VELRHLRSFVMVAEELHFGRAAERLHIAGPPLSKQIQQLESELGFPLLERSTRRVALTAGGEVFLQRARGLLGDLDDAQSDAARAHRGDTGRLSVGFSGSASYELLPRLLREYRERYPQVEIEPHGEMLSARQLEAVEQGRLDVGFVRGTAFAPGITTRTVWSEPLVALLPAEHPLAARELVQVSELEGSPFVSYWESMLLADAVHNSCRRAGFTPSVVQRAGESYGLACLVAAGFGVALVPRAARHMQLSGVRFVPVPVEQSDPVTLTMAWRRGDRAPATRNFLRLVRAVAPNDYDA
jgi:DNA-binding transcriptional LysR family regulator